MNLLKFEGQRSRSYQA